MIQIGLACLLALLILGASRLLGFWAFLVLLGGILAHFGDHLGTMVGKKRLSLFGFRPKHTAILVNFTTGALITMATLLGAVCISAEYREALIGVQAKQAEKERIIQESRDLSTKLEGSQQRLKELESELRKADDTRQALASEIAQKTIAKQRAEALADRLRATKETGTVAIHKDHILVRHPLLVPITVSKAQLKVALLSMMAELRETVTSEGVTVPPAKPDRIDPDLVDPILGKIEGFRSFYQGSASAEFGGPTPKQIYICPRARTNLARGEALSGVQFDVKPNIVVLVKNEEIARTPVNGALDQEKLLQQLINFDKSVQQELRRRGVLDEALDERLNSFSVDILMNFLNIIQLAKKEKRWCMVRLFASEDISSYGSINTSCQVVEATEDDLPDAPETAGSPASSPAPRSATTTAP